ncbi:MAG TPA: DUF6152 family protein [Gammaproteobacteria bacterium]
MGRVVKSVRSWAALGAFMGLVTTAAPARAHHSLAMYDGTKVRVFTGVVTRISPGGSHVQILFAPLDEERQAVIRDEKGEPVIWTLELTGAAQAAREGITVKSFAEGTIFSAALHPLRSGDPGGSREGPMYKCPENTPPEPGKHCDSVAGSTMHGQGTLPTPTD